MNTHIKTLIVVVGVCAGIVVGETSVFGSEIALVSFLFFFMQLLVYLWSKKKFSIDGARSGEVSGQGSQIALASLLLFISVSVGIVRAQLVVPLDRFICEASCTFDARIVKSPEIQDAYQVMDVQPLADDKGSAKMRVADVRIRVPLYPSYKVGEILTLKGKVAAPKSIPSHDGKKPFDYDSYLALKNVGSEMFFPSVLTHKESGMTFVESLMTFRQKLAGTVSTYVSEPAASLASGTLLGDAQMSKELVETFRVAGLSHIIVLSGFNIAILITVLLLLLKPLPLPLRVSVAFIIVVTFVLMVGGEASVVRAALMAFVALLALLVGRGYVAHQALLLSFLSIILYSPEALLSDASLHLSFLATAGIVYTSDGLKKSIERCALPSVLILLGYVEILSTTLAAYVATLPYLLYTFGTVSVYGLIANFLVLPFVPLVMLMTFLVILLSPVSVLLAQVLGYLVTLAAGMIISVAHIVESFPYSSFVVSLSFSQMVLMYFFGIVLYKLFMLRGKNETWVTNENEITSGIISY